MHQQTKQTGRLEIIVKVEEGKVPEYLVLVNDDSFKIFSGNADAVDNRIREICQGQVLHPKPQLQIQ